MRRAFILILLLGGMQLILPLGGRGQGSEALLSFGFLILAAYTVGEIASMLRLPKIVGYLVSGVIFGPDVLGTVSEGGVRRLTGVSELAVALIAFLAGAELRWQDVRLKGVMYLKIMTAELSIAFLAMVAFLMLVRGWVPFLADLPLVQALILAVLFASIAIVHSPAVTMALLTETKARGPVAQTTLGVVLLSDVAVVLLFSATLALARAFVPSPGGAETATLPMVVWEITGALLVGALLGALVALYLRFFGRELMLFAILVAFFGMEIAGFAHVELLLTLLTAGFVAENVSKHGDELREAMERSAAPVFVVFFALSGAKIEVADVAALIPIVVPLALVRAGAIRFGSGVGARWGDASDPERKLVWMGLVSQAGVAIGLAAIVAQAYPSRGPQLAALLLALIAINETVGPILFRKALFDSGETGLARPGAPAGPPEAGEPAASPSGARG